MGVWPGAHVRGLTVQQAAAHIVPVAKARALPMRKKKRKIERQKGQHSWQQQILAIHSAIDSRIIQAYGFIADHHCALYHNAYVQLHTAFHNPTPPNTCPTASKYFLDWDRNSIPPQNTVPHPPSSRNLLNALQEIYTLNIFLGRC